MNMSTALIVNTDKNDAKHFSAMLEAEGFCVGCTYSIAEAKKWLDQHIPDLAPDLAIIALDMPDGDSLQLLNHEALRAKAEIILTSRKEDTLRVRKGISAGASYFFHCPSDERFLAGLVKDIKAEISPQEPGRDTLANVTPIDQFGLLRGRCEKMRDIYRTVRRVAPTNASVFIYGESGTGKELVAQSIHLFSNRREDPFVALNCGAIPKDLIESELFGHEKGSFSGADKRHIGYFDRAHTGTLFLDEVTEMPPDLQIKLLRVLESGTFRLVGGEKEKTSDVRILAASNRDPEQAVAQGRLREDLYYRLAGFPIHIPPLRERGDDIKGLIQYFLIELNDESGTRKTISVEVLDELQRYSWPGNVRELHNVIRQAYIMANNVITTNELPNLSNANFPTPQTGSSTGPAVVVRVGEQLRTAERKLILASLARLNGNKAQCAKILAISLKTLYNRLNEYKREKEAADREATVGTATSVEELPAQRYRVGRLASRRNEVH